MSRFYEVNQRLFQYSVVHYLLQELRLNNGCFQRYFLLCVTQFNDIVLV